MSKDENIERGNESVKEREPSNIGGEMDAVPEERVESARNDETSAPVGDTSLGELARILDHTSYQDDDD